MENSIDYSLKTKTMKYRCASSNELPMLSRAPSLRKILFLKNTSMLTGTHKHTYMNFKFSTDNNWNRLAIVIIVLLISYKCYINSRQSCLSSQKYNYHPHVMSSVDLTNLTVVTRVHSLSASSLPKSDLVIEFVISCLPYSSHVIICISIGDNFEHIEYIQSISELLKARDLSEKVSLLSISPWGNFVTPLNSAILEAKKLGYHLICFQSFEFKITVESVDKLLANFLTPDMLVVGPRLPGHDFQIGENRLRGRTCPWNTFAIWNLKFLLNTGFLLISDGSFEDPTIGGVEEVAAINTLQFIHSNSLVVKLVQIHDINWMTNFTDAKRLQYHENKMKTKDSRPQAQMSILGIPDSIVIHEENE